MAAEPNDICGYSEPYYYDYLGEKTKKKVPANALDHIARCEQCRAKTERLKLLLEEADTHPDSRQRLKDSATNTLLRLHLAYIGRPVRCSTAKSFFPGLADPVFKIFIPTPITVHIDNCPSCENDLLALRDLGLTHDQLCRLEQLLGDKSAKEAVGCSQANLAIHSVVAMAFREIDAGVLNHVCTCPDCRELVYRRRETIREGLSRTEVTQQKYACQELSATDLFDYCFPYCINAVSDKHAKRRPDLISHVLTCPMCLGKMQQLHRTVHNIAERSDSDIVTCFTLTGQVGKPKEPKTGGLYAAWPVRVVVLGKSDSMPTTSHEQPELQ